MKPYDKNELKQSETKENILALSIFGVLLLLVVGLLTNGFGLLGKNSGSELGENIAVPFDGSPIRGNISQAKVIIYIFSDFECPFCKKGEDTVQRVFEKYNGKVALIFKHYPLTSIHPNALNSALAAECANEQEKFWEYHDFLFSHQNALSLVDLKAYAVELGLETERFNSCLDLKRHAARINKDVAAGRNIGVTSTPTFIINGKGLVGAQPEPEFDKIILEALK